MSLYRLLSQMVRLKAASQFDWSCDPYSLTILVEPLIKRNAFIINSLSELIMKIVFNRLAFVAKNDSLFKLIIYALNAFP